MLFTAEMWQLTDGLSPWRPASILAGPRAVFSMTANEFRQRYFAGILDEIVRALAVRAVYLAMLRPRAADREMAGQR